MSKKSNTISKLLERRGIDNIEDLSPEELAQVKQWQVVLQGEVTVDKIKDFCLTQIRVLESKCDGVNPISMVQQAAIHVYINILKLIESSDVAREAQEMYLNQLINS